MFGLEQSQRPIVGGSGRISKMTMCVSGGATKANTLCQTSITANVCIGHNATSPLLLLGVTFGLHDLRMPFFCFFDAHNSI